MSISPAAAADATTEPTPAGESSDPDGTPAEPSSDASCDVSSATGTDPAGARPGEIGPGWLARTALMVTVLLSAGLLALHVGAYSELSPYDEPVHVDYVYHVLNGEIVVAGDRLTPEAQDVLACRGVEFPVALPPCGGPYGLADFPGGGHNTAYIHSPVYYALTAGLSVGLDVLPGDLVDAMRLTGAVWLALALALMWSVLRDLGVGWPVRMASGLALTAVPIVLLSHSTVNNDVTALPAGAAVVLAALRWDRGRLNVWWLAALGTVAMLLKSTNLAVLIALAVFVLVRAVQRRGPTLSAWRAVLARRSLLTVAIVGVGIVVGGLVWTVIYPLLATVDPTSLSTNSPFIQKDFQPFWLAEQLDAVTSPLLPQFYDRVLSGGLTSAIGDFANYGILAVAVVGAVRAAPGSVVRALAAGAAVAMAAYGPLMVIINFVVAHAYFSPFPARYGLSLVPALLVVGATAIRSKRAQVGALVVGGGVFAAMTAQLVDVGW